MPSRIQRKRTHGWKLPRHAVYVGRPSKWGNPFVVGKRFENLALWIAINGTMTPEQIEQWHGEHGFLVRDNAHAVALFRQYALWMINDTSAGKAWIEQLRGRDLVCWCSENSPCHADVLLEFANASARHNLLCCISV